MSQINGDVRDTGYQSLYGVAVVLKWTLNEPASTTNGLVVASFTRTITPGTTGAVSWQTVSTDLMHQDAYYTVQIAALNPTAGLPDMDFPEWRIKVPEGTHNLADLIRAANGGRNPLLWYWQPEIPDSWPIGAVWVNSVTGDVNQKVG